MNDPKATTSEAAAAARSTLEAAAEEEIAWRCARQETRLNLAPKFEFPGGKQQTWKGELAFSLAAPTTALSPPGPDDEAEDDDEEEDDDDDVFVDDPNIVSSSDDVNVRTGRSLRVGQGRIGHALRT